MVMLNSTVNTLDVCEVCGSYQCPYCPVYSSATPLLPSSILGVLLLLVLVAGDALEGSRGFGVWGAAGRRGGNVG